MADIDQSETFEQARAELPDVSPHVSVFWKPLRCLLEEGKPIDPVTVLFYDLGDGKRLPFAAVAKTPGDRLILWPAWDASEPGESEDGQAFPIHHATLELANGRTHFTYFGAGGQRLHEDCGWELASFKGGLQLWLVSAFSVGLLEQQVGALEQKVRVPEINDPKRREREFARYAAEMKSVDLQTPPLRGNCLVSVIHLMPDSAGFRGPIEPAHFPMGSFWNDWIDGWADGDSFQIAPTGVNVGGVNLIVLTAAPLGCLRASGFLGASSSHP